MTQARTQWKVGLFVSIGLLLLAGLVMKFSKSSSYFTKAYELKLKTSNVGGIIPGAVVLMAGVPVGNVATVELDSSGKLVTIHLRILMKYKIYPDADFSIKQQGFLGDRYISVVPKQNKGEPLKSGQEVWSQEPFDLQEVARSAAGLLQRVDETAKKLNDAVARIDRTLFAEDTLTNLSGAIANFRNVSERALNTIDAVDQFVRTNTHPLSASVSNLVLFSRQMNEVSLELQQTIATNRDEVTAAIKNIESASIQVDKLVTEVQAGKGLAGSLFKSEQLQQDVLNTVNNLSVLSSNLSRFGILYKPRVKNPSAAKPNLPPGKAFR